MDAVIAVSSNNKLLLSGDRFVQNGVSIGEILYMLPAEVAIKGIKPLSQSGKGS